MKYPRLGIFSAVVGGLLPACGSVDARGGAEDRDGAVVSGANDAGVARDTTAPSRDTAVRMDTKPAADSASNTGVVTFTDLYRDIMSTSMAASASSCWGADCHNPGKESALDFSSKASAYTSMLAKGDVIVARKPDTSLLVQLLESNDAKVRMPLGRPALPAALAAKVRAWVTAGAKND